MYGLASTADPKLEMGIDPGAVPPSERNASRWSEMDHTARTKQALAGGQLLHPDFAQNVFENAGLSISWNNQPYQRGLAAFHMPLSRPKAYERLIRPIDRVGRVYLAGDSISYQSGWQEGAVRSAWWTLGQIKDHLAAQGSGG